MVNAAKALELWDERERLREQLKALEAQQKPAVVETRDIADGKVVSLAARRAEKIFAEALPEFQEAVHNLDNAKIREIVSRVPESHRKKLLDSVFETFGSHTFTAYDVCVIDSKERKGANSTAQTLYELGATPNAIALEIVICGRNIHAAELVLSHIKPSQKEMSLLLQLAILEKTDKDVEMVELLFKKGTKLSSFQENDLIINSILDSNLKMLKFLVETVGVKINNLSILSQLDGSSSIEVLKYLLPKLNLNRNDKTDMALSNHLVKNLVYAGRLSDAEFVMRLAAKGDSEQEIRNMLVQLTELSKIHRSVKIEDVKVMKEIEKNLREFMLPKLRIKQQTANLKYSFDLLQPAANDNTRVAANDNAQDAVIPLIVRKHEPIPLTQVKTSILVDPRTEYINAVRAGNYSRARLLFRNDFSDATKSLMQDAITTGNVELAQFLLGYGAPANQACVTQAIQRGNIQLAELFINSGDLTQSEVSKVLGENGYRTVGSECEWSIRQKEESRFKKLVASVTVAVCSFFSMKTAQSSWQTQVQEVQSAPVQIERTVSPQNFRTEVNSGGGRLIQLHQRTTAHEINGRFGKRNVMSDHIRRG